MKPNNLKRIHSPLLTASVTIVLILLMRFTTLGHLPFLDASDSRYALVAKLMADDGEWFVPKIYRDGFAIPFWSKPPFHFWLEAASVKIFGENEFAARLPSFVAGVVMLALTGYCGYRLLGKQQAVLSVLMLSTSGLFFFLAGSTLVDLTLSAAVSGVMTSAILSTRSELGRERGIWGLLLFLFLAVGFLTKGPIAVVFPVSAIGLWMFLRKDAQLLRQLPWKRGALGFLLLTVPVFLLQEYFTPGYLRYFFINENVLRYLVADYGEKYGSGHRQPYGTSWILLFAGFLPWTLLLPALSWKQLRITVRDSNMLYLVCWIVAPTAVLMFARQLLGTYLVPTFGGLALFLSACLMEQDALSQRRTQLALLRVLALVLVSISLAVFAWSITEGFSLRHAAASVVILLLLLWSALSLQNEQTPYHSFCLSALLIALFYTSQIQNLCKYSQRQYSIVAAVRLLEQRHKVHRPALYFPFGVPNSAYLYAHQRVIDGRNAPQLSLKSQNELIVIRDKQLEDFRRRFGSRFQELLRHGKWRFLHTENHPRTCISAMRRTHDRRRQPSLGVRRSGLPWGSTQTASAHGSRTNSATV